MSSYYVSPTGLSTNPGTELSPWSFRHACSGASGTIIADDIVSLLPGSYLGHFSITVSGTSGHPIIFTSFDPLNPSVVDGNIETTITTSIPSGASGDTLTIHTSDVLDFSIGTVIAFAGLLQQLSITGISGLAVTGVRNGSNGSGGGGGACGALPVGTRVWSILTPMITIDVTAHDINLVGLEITDSGTDSRLWTTSSDSDFENQSARRQDGVFVYAARTKVIDCIIHDCFNGLGTWEQAVNSSHTGNVIYSNGFYAPDRGHGHGMYVQNNTGTKTFTQNVSFNNFGYAHQLYGGDAAHLNNTVWNQNVEFGDSGTSSPPLNLGVLFGGSASINNLTISNNHFYKTTWQLGYAGANTGISITGNTFRTSAILSLSTGVTITGNLFIGKGVTNTYLISLGNGSAFSVGDYGFSGNTYFRTNITPPSSQFFVSPDPAGDSCGYYWYNAAQTGYGYCGAANHSWQVALGYDASGSSYTPSTPTGTEIISLTDPENADRHTVVIYNWNLADTISVDVSGYGFTPGQSYRWHNSADYFNDANTFVYDGSGILSLPMTGHTVAKPNGYPDALGTTTFPEFGTFIVESSEASVSDESTFVTTTFEIRTHLNARLTV